MGRSLRPMSHSLGLTVARSHWSWTLSKPPVWTSQVLDYRYVPAYMVKLSMSVYDFLRENNRMIKINREELRVSSPVRFKELCQRGDRRTVRARGDGRLQGNSSLQTQQDSCTYEFKCGNMHRASTGSSQIGSQCWEEKCDVGFSFVCCECVLLPLVNNLLWAYSRVE